MCLLAFLLNTLWCRQSGDLPKNNLAKFGYIINMNIKIKQNPSIFLASI
jgi:hypothetical protein